MTFNLFPDEFIFGYLFLYNKRGGKWILQSINYILQLQIHNDKWTAEG